MAEAVAPELLDYAAYLELERTTEQRHEYLRGRTHAMAGGSLADSALAVAVAAELRALAKGCQVFSSDAKIRVESTGLSTYPDVSIVCGAIERDAQDRHAIKNPTVLVEVLSPSTEAYDRGDKLAHYRELASLRAYVLVSPHERRIEVFTRELDGSWTLRGARAGDTIAVPPLSGQLAVDAVYDGVELELPAPRAAHGS